MKRWYSVISVSVGLCVLCLGGAYVYESVWHQPTVVHVQVPAKAPASLGVVDRGSDLDKPTKSALKPVHKKQLAARPNGLIGSPGATCRIDPLAGVWGPKRLRVLNPCRTVSGIVQQVEYMPSDGDYHFKLKLDAQYSKMLFAANMTKANGDLVVEIIPMDDGKFPVPSDGEHVTLTGAYVLDTGHGWAELHPVWRINGKGSAAYTEDQAYQSVLTALNKGIHFRSTATVSLISSQTSVRPGQYASVTVKTLPKAAGVLFIHYGTHVEQLAYQYADAAGVIKWRWRVGTNVIPGVYPMYVEVYARRLNLRLTVQPAKAAPVNTSAPTTTSAT